MFDFFEFGYSVNCNYRINLEKFQIVNNISLFLIEKHSNIFVKIMRNHFNNRHNLPQIEIFDHPIIFLHLKGLSEYTILIIISNVF